MGCTRTEAYGPPPGRVDSVSVRDRRGEDPASARLARIKPEAHPRRGAYVAPADAVRRLDLVAQPRDVGTQNLRIVRIARPPDLDQKRTMGQQPSAIADQRPQ